MLVPCPPPICSACYSALLTSLLIPHLSLTVSLSLWLCLAYPSFKGVVLVSLPSPTSFLSLYHLQRWFLSRHRPRPLFSSPHCFWSRSHLSAIPNTWSRPVSVLDARSHLPAIPDARSHLPIVPDPLYCLVTVPDLVLISLPFPILDLPPVEKSDGVVIDINSKSESESGRLGEVLMRAEESIL